MTTASQVFPNLWVGGRPPEGRSLALQISGCTPLVSTLPTPRSFVLFGRLQISGCTPLVSTGPRQSTYHYAAQVADIGLHPVGFDPGKVEDAGADAAELQLSGCTPLVSTILPTSAL